MQHARAWGGVEGKDCAGKQHSLQLQLVPRGGGGGHFMHNAHAEYLNSMVWCGTVTHNPFPTYFTSGRRFEPGALGQLARAVNVTSLHLQVLPESNSSSVSPLSPSAAAAAAGSPGKSPSELARLQVGLQHYTTGLVQFA